MKRLETVPYMYLRIIIRISIAHSHGGGNLTVHDTYYEIYNILYQVYSIEYIDCTSIVRE